MESINNMKKELQGLKEGFVVDIRIDSLRVTHKKVPNWKTPANDGMYGFWFKRFISIHDRLDLQQ